MSQKTNRPDNGRRSFLKKLGLAGGAVGAATLATQVQAQAPAPEQPAENSSGYRETDHIRSYYDSARN